jgi:hypothetical protein
MGSRGSAKLRGRLEGGPPSRTRPRVQARDDVVRDPDPGATHAVRHRVRVDVVVELRARVRVDLFADVVRFVDRIGRRRTLQDRHNVLAGRNSMSALYRRCTIRGRLTGHVSGPTPGGK